MYRNIESRLEEWRTGRGRLPLIIRGPRQVGKTWSVIEFGRKYFRNIVYLNFESNRGLAKVFEGDLRPDRIIRELSVITGETVIEDHTLLFFDEIQSCPQALTSLKYFAELAPGYAIVSAGSLLGVAVVRDSASFPVGKVRILDMHPLGFDEYMIALRGRDAVDIIRESFISFRPCPLHDTFNELFRSYVYTGGMPRVVKEHIENSDPLYADIIRKDISDGFVTDMARYAEKSETVRIMSAYNSIPAQLARANTKFQYSLVKKGGRAVEFSHAIDWLKAAGIVIPCYRVSEGKFPLSASAEQQAFKLFHFDTGILAGMAGITSKSVIAAAGGNFRGALAENSVASGLHKTGHPLFYWESAGRAEIDFLIQINGMVIPVEVKSAENVRSRSLSEYVNRYSPPWSYRVSEKNFGYENNIRSIPFYALFCI